MLNVWNWLEDHIGAILSVLFSGAFFPIIAWISNLRKQRREKRSAKGINSQHKQEQKVLAVEEIANQRLQEQRRETCLRLLTSIRELVQIVAEYRQAHDNLWVRQGIFFNSRQHVKKINAQFQSIHNKLALAGSELSIDPNGKGVMDAFVAYMQAQNRYIQEIMKPMKRPLTFPFGKTDIAVLDALSKKADEQLSVLEKVVQDFIQSS